MKTMPFISDDSVILSSSTFYSLTKKINMKTGITKILSVVLMTLALVAGAKAQSLTTAYQTTIRTANGWTANTSTGTSTSSNYTQNGCVFGGGSAVTISTTQARCTSDTGEVGMAGSNRFMDLPSIAFTNNSGGTSAGTLSVKYYNNGGGRTVAYYLVNSQGLTIANSGTVVATSTSGTNGSCATANFTLPAITGSKVIKLVVNGNAGMVAVTVQTYVSCTAPTITTQPATGTQTTCQNGTAFSALTAAATGTPTPTYQWYSNASNSNSGGTLISGATNASYTPSNTTSGVLYYYCVASSSGCTATTNQSGAITVTALPSPTFTTTPAANSTQGVDVTYTTQSGKSSYVWDFGSYVLNTDYSITSGGISSTDNTVTLKWLTTGSKTITVGYSANGCASSSSASSTTNILSAASIFYNKPNSNVDDVANWSTNTNGVGGSQPTDFTTAGQTFNLINSGASMSGAWNVSGAGSSVAIGDGTNAVTFNATSVFTAPTVNVGNAATLQIQTNTVPTFGTISTGSTIEYAASSGTQVVAPTSYGNLILSGGGTRTFSGTTNIAGTFTPGSGFSANAGTIVLNGTSSSQAIPGFSYNGLTVSGVDGKSTAGNISVAGTLTMNNSFTIATNHTLSFASTATMASTTGFTLTVNGTFITNQTTDTFKVGNGAMLVNGTFKVTGLSGATSGAFTFSGVTFASGVNGGTFYIASGVRRLVGTYAGNVVWDVASETSGAMLVNTSTTINGNFTVKSTGGGNNYIFFNSGSSARGLIVNGDVFIQGGRLALTTATGTAACTLTTNNLYVTGGKLFVTDATATGATLNIKGNLIHTSSDTLGIAAGSGTIVFNGTAMQDISTTGLSRAVGVTLNNSNGARLLTDLSVAGTLTLTSGKLRTNGKTVTMTGSSSSISGPAFGAASTSYIALCDSVGTLSTTGGLTIQSIGTGGRTSAVLFPVGPNTSSYNPVTITNTIAAVDYTVRVNQTAISGVTPSTASVNNTWNIQPSGSHAATLAMQWVTADEGSTFTRSVSAVAHYDGSSIDVQSGGGIASGSSPYTYSSTGSAAFTGSGDFGITNGVLVPATEPTVQASAVNFTSVTSTSMTINWTSGNGANRIVLVKSASAVDATAIDGTSYTANTVFGSGTQIGTGNYVVYTGTGNAVTITGLTTGGTYYVSVMEFNGNAGTENYLTTSPATGNATTTQTVYTWVGGTSSAAALADRSNWSTAGVGGAAVGTSGTLITFTTSDKLVWDGSNYGGNTTGTANVTIGAALSVGQMIFQNNATVAWTSGSSSRTITINGAVGTDLSIDATSSLYVGAIATSSGSQIPITLTSAATAIIAGNLYLGNATNTSQSNHFITANAVNAITFQSGSTCTYNLSSSQAPFGTSIANSVIFSSGSTMRGIKGGDVFSGTGSTIFQTGSTYEYAGNSNALPFTFGTAAQTYSNFVCNHTVAVSPVFTASVTVDSLIVASTAVGALTLKFPSLSLTVKGHIINKNTTNALIFDIGANGTGTLNIAGTSAQSILNAGGGITFGSSTTTRILAININNAAGVTIGNSNYTGNVTCLASDSLIMKTGVLNIGTTNFTLSGQVNRDGTTNTGTISTSGNDSVFVTGPSILPSGLFTSNTLRNIIINRSAGVTLASNLTVSGSLTLTSGVLYTGSNILNVSSGTSSRTSGWVYGNYRKNVSVGSNVVRTFEIGDSITNYTPISTTFASVTTAGDLIAATAKPASGEANYASYPLSTTAYINRYWSLTNVNTLAFTNYSATVNYVAGDRIGGATQATVKFGLYGSSWVTNATTTAATNSNTATGLSSLGDIILGNCISSVTPTDSITSTSTAVCTGSSVTFTVTSTNGGSAPTYQWKKNGSNIGSGGTTLTLQDYEVTSGDVITCVMTANNACQTAATATSNAITLTVGTVTPSVSISTASSAICNGDATSFTAAGNNGGSSPSFQWKKNGFNAGVGTSITFLPNTLNNNDVISCVLTANNLCQTTATANSNSIQLTVKTSPSIGSSTISAATLCSLGTTTTVYNSNTQGGGVWSSSNPAIATVSTSNGSVGTVTTVGYGIDTLTYSKTASNGCVSSASTYLSVISPTAPNAISGSNSVCPTKTIQLSTTSTGGVWSTASGSIASVNAATGVVTGNSPGVSIIKYTITTGSCSASATYAVTVNQTPTVPSIQYAAGTSNPQTGTGGAFCVGKVFKVVGSPSISPVVSGLTGVWSSSNPAVMTVTAAGSGNNRDTGLVSLIAAGTGSLTYTVTSPAGCVNSRSVSGVTVTTCFARGVNMVDGQQSTVDGITMYPNPAKTFISLNVKTLIGNGSIVVTDLYGKQVKTQVLSMGNNTVDIANLSKGFYLVSINTNEGKTTRKLVVE